MSAFSEEVDWIRVCAVDEVRPGDAIVLPRQPPIAVFNVEGDFYATDDTCTHAESSLANGYIDGDIVECAFHWAKFNIKTGAALTAPAFVNLQIYETRITGSDVFVNVALRAGSSAGVSIESESS